MAYLDFSWILEGSLAGAQGPTSRRDLTFLKLQEIGAIIRMAEDTISGEALEMVDLYEPVNDGQPPSIEQLDRMARFIEEQIETWERPVVVTCHAGMGRTGTALAAFMVYVGYLPETAVKLIRELRPGSISSPAQEAAVGEYSEFLKEQERERRRKAIDAMDNI